MILNFRFPVVPTLILLLSFAASSGTGAISNSKTAAAIEATATVIYPVGVIVLSDSSTEYLLYHPSGAGILITATGASGDATIRTTRDPISRLDPARFTRSDTVTVIYTEN